MFSDHIFLTLFNEFQSQNAYYHLAHLMVQQIAIQFDHRFQAIMLSFHCYAVYEALN